jgi:DNA-binding CsgD family transcriptional regulator
MARIATVHLEHTVRRLGEAVLDPALWPEVIEELSRATGSFGALLVDSNGRGPGAQHTRSQQGLCTPSLAEPTATYFADGWAARDPRAMRGFWLALCGQVFLDQDIFTPDELRAAPLYNEFLYPAGLGWMAGIGFQVNGAWWALSLQRTPQDGPFDPQDKPALASLMAPLSDAATLSAAVGRSVITGMTDALDLVGRPALAIDRSGSALGWNEAADRLFGEDIRIRDRRLFVRNRAAAAAVNRLLDQLCGAADEASLRTEPVIVPRDGRPPLVLRALSISAAARTPFLGARALLTLTDLAPSQPQPSATPRDLMRIFGLTPAEARLAVLIGTGMSPGEAAEQLAISRETVRTQLKSVLAKTDTHRQGELVALLARLGPA